MCPNIQCDIFWYKILGSKEGLGDSTLKVFLSSMSCAARAQQFTVRSAVSKMTRMEGQLDTGQGGKLKSFGRASDPVHGAAAIRIHEPQRQAMVLHGLPPVHYSTQDTRHGVQALERIRVCLVGGNFWIRLLQYFCLYLTISVQLQINQAQKIHLIIYS